MNAAAIPVLPRGVRLHHDRVRGVWVLLAPERALMLDPAGHAILSAIDGRRSLGAIAADLATRFGAPEETVLADTAEYLTGLAERRIVEVRT